MKENKLNQDRLKELLFYDEHTGHFIRNVTCGGQIKGSVAGRKSSSGIAREKIIKELFSYAPII